MSGYQDYYDELIDEILYEEYNHLDENILNKAREYVRKNVVFPYAVRHDISQTPGWFSAKNRREKVTKPVARHIINRVLKKVGIKPSTGQQKQPEQKPESKVVLPSRTANPEKYEQEKARRQSMPKNPRYSKSATSVRTYGEEVNYIVDTLIDEGYANDVDSALNIFEAMSEDWLYSLLEQFPSNRNLSSLPLNVGSGLGRRSGEPGSALQPGDFTRGKSQEEIDAAAKRRRARGRLTFVDRSNESPGRRRQ